MRTYRCRSVVERCRSSFSVLGEELETVRGEYVFMCVPPGRPPGVAVSPYRSRLPPVSAYRYCTLGTETYLLESRVWLCAVSHPERAVRRTVVCNTV